MSICVSKSCLKLTAVDSVFTCHLMKVTPQEGYLVQQNLVFIKNKLAVV